MKTQETQACTQTPISWLELERYVLGESLLALEIDEHVAACSACDSVLQLIRRDERSMPALEISIAHIQPAKRGLIWRYLLALAPLAMLFIWLSLRTDDPSTATGGVKGSESSFHLVRENASRILQATHFGKGDRFKAFVTCAPSFKGAVFVDLVVEQDNQLTYPLAVAELNCGNQVPVPGAFSLEGGRARVCLTLATRGPPPRDSIPAKSMCLELLPEN